MTTETIFEELTEDDIAARLAALRAGETSPEPAIGAPSLGEAAGGASPGAPRGYRYFAPLEEAADEYISWAQKPHERIYTGIPVFDAAMRGTAPGELTLIVGFAHSGKTVFVSEVILNNREKRIAFFTPDETRVLVLVKLTSLVHGVSAEELEERIAYDDDEAKELVRSTARDHFPNLAVFDSSMDLPTMHKALDEVEDHWGGKTQLVIFDYLDLLGDGEDARSLATAIKGWGKNRRVPLYVLHQSSRTAGKDGQMVTINSGGYGGEQQATHMIGVRRKKNELNALIRELEEKIASQSDPKPQLLDRLAEAKYDLTVHENTVTFNLVKNKRPPGRLVDDTDFILDRDTGRIRELPQQVASVAAIRHAAFSMRGGVQPSLDEAF